MKTYLVGGSVRDKLLGITPHDTDYLITESSEDELSARGLVKVGQSFPIFLDRSNGDEYTLAELLEEDLGRRDLSINAIAMDETGNLIDPFNGSEDLKNKILRHVKRESFFTDPLRVIRTARFLIQLPGFKVHPETLELMREVAKTDEFDRLPGERIIKELKRVLCLQNASLFFKTLESVGALSPHLKEFVNVPDSYPDSEDDSVRFAWLCSNIIMIELDSLCSRLGIQNDWKETAGAWIKFRSLNPGLENLLEYFYTVDAFRRPEIIEKLSVLDYIGMKDVRNAFDLISGIGITSIDQKLTGKDISAAIREARLVKLVKSFS